jgi:hypothetical protein
LMEDGNFQHACAASGKDKPNLAMAPAMSSPEEGKGEGRRGSDVDDVVRMERCWVVSTAPNLRQGFLVR